MPFMQNRDAKPTYHALIPRATTSHHASAMKAAVLDDTSSVYLTEMNQNV